MKISPLSQFTVERLSLISDKPFASVLAAIRDGIGHPDMGRDMERRLLSKSRIDRETCARSDRLDGIWRIR